MHTKFQLENLKDRDKLEDLGVDDKIMALGNKKSDVLL
jgi:hypothetical protein